MKLGLLHVKVNRTVNTSESTGRMASLVKKYNHLFNGIGKLKNHQQKLHVDPNVKPVAQKPRRVPFHLRKQVSARIDELKKLDIIEPATGPTTWVSPIVAAPKPHNSSEVRVCGDYRQPNLAITRERHPIPTVEELMEDMTGASVFSKIDLRAGYHQIELAEESRDVTTFCTHDGLYRYKRLPFGISSASEVFQNAIQQTLQNLKGVRNIADDVIVWGSTQEDHDRNLEALFKRLDESGLTLNEKKCEYNQPSLWFYGYILSKDGLSADPKKVDAILKTSIPRNASQLRSFLGLASYCARFIRNFASISSPLRELTKKNTKWQWTNVHQLAFDKIKTAIADDCIMAFYDPSKETTLTVDASPVGLGAILSQTQDDGTVRNISYASRSLTATERRYSQTEKEALAVVWGCERFHLYLIGKEFVLYTDHKPLETIYSPKSKPPPRIERWLLRLQQYQYRVKYRPGASNPADVLSRQPNESDKWSLNTADKYINFVQRHAVPKSMTLEEIVTATATDPELQALINAVQSGNWFDQKDPKYQYTKAYHQLRNEFSVTDNGILLRDTRIVMPKSL